MKKNKHEIYFDKVDFIKILQQYEDNQNSSYTEEQLLLVAKAYFIQQLYTECISLLKSISHNKKAKILFEKQTLLFKATYLLDSHNISQLKIIIQEFEYAQRFITDKNFSPYHYKVFEEFKTFLQNQKQKSLNQSGKISESDEDLNQVHQEGKRITEQQKRFQKQTKIQGFPCFLVEKNWRKFQSNYYSNNKNVKRMKDKDSRIIYVSQQPFYPGPITNFSIVNHIFEVIPYENKSQHYLNIILFPGQEYEVVSKAHWNYLYETYGGIPVRRIFQTVPITRFSNAVSYQQNMTVKLTVSYLNNIQVMQAQSYSLWTYSVIPQLCQRYGMGQLKQKQGQNNFKLVGQGRVFQPQNEQPLKFITFENHNIYNLTTEDIKFRDRLFHRFDLQKYSIQNSPSKGLVGLTNDKFLCFMNSTLQCLSNTHDLSEFFLNNSYIKDLNFSKSNDIGSRGEITCAYADIIKRIWSLTFQSQRDAQINPSIFKEVFAKRFQNFVDDSQQDAHEFLNFLLNCMHDDLNVNFKVSSKKVMRSMKDTTNFQEVRKVFMQNYETYNKSQITQLFKGYTYSTLKCLSCSAKYYNFDMHLTFPLPVPSTNASITVYFIDEGEIIKYSIFVQNIRTVRDLIKKVQNKQNTLSPTRAAKYKVPNQCQFYLFGIHKITHKIQTFFSPETSLQKLLGSQDKNRFVLYSVKKTNDKNDSPRGIRIGSQIDSQHQQNQQSLKLTMIQYFFDDQKKGLPLLVYLDSFSSEDKLQQIAAQGITDQSLKYSGGVATQKEKLSCIQKVKLQKIKGKSYQNVLKVKLNKNLSLFQDKQKSQFIGQQSQKPHFTLNDCLNIFHEKDKISQEQGWICGKCKKPCACEREQKIYNVGSHLIIVLKRFKQDQKVCSKIEYPIQNLDISQYIDENFKANNPKMKFIYDLYGVIIHRGNLNRGHYYSYCKNKQTQKWYLFDDELVRQQNDLRVIVNENAYVLFYRIKQY